MTDDEALTARLRACWVRRDNFRLSAAKKWDEPCLRALVVEYVRVDERVRRQGVCKRFLARVVAEPGYDLYVVEAVQSPHLADALMRWDWDFDPEVMDFYWPPGLMPDRRGEHRA